jgi:membrane-associated phospholipid phosphatase
MHVWRRLSEGVFIASCLLVSLGAWAGPDPQAPQRPTYVIDASFRPQLTPPPTAGSAEARAEVDEILALNKSRTEDQYWRVINWDRASALGPWIRLELHAISSTSLNPIRASRALSLVSAAVNDAIVVSSRVRAQVRRTSPCETLPELSVLDYWCPEYSYPSEHAVVAGAASTVLGYLFPMDARHYQELAAEAGTSRVWGGLAYRSDVDAGLELGRQVGQLAVARARADGSDAIWRGSIPIGSGKWRPTPPMALDGFAPPVEPSAGSWRPWSLTSGDQFRPAPPPKPDDPEFWAGMREVYDVSKSLTIEQQQVTQFWSDGAGTATPAGHWNTIALDLIKKYMVYTEEAAVILGALNTAQADAFIACWDAKFAYWQIRPITAIRQGIDGTWNPYLQTPFFPSYVSGHATVSGAAAEILAYFFPKDAGWLRDWAKTAARSRLYGGIHTTIENEEGLRLGRRVAGATLQRLGGVMFTYE